MVNIIFCGFGDDMDKFVHARMGAITKREAGVARQLTDRLRCAGQPVHRKKGHSRQTV